QQLADVQSRGAVLGTEDSAVTVEREGNLHHGERLRYRRRASGGWPDLRYRPHHVPAQLFDPATARDRRGRARKGIFPLEPDGQLRMEQRLRRPLRTGARGFQNAAAHAQVERRVVPRGCKTQCGYIVELVPAEGLEPTTP